ncbi:hypothetical protein [Streptomyces sp. DH8]|uniref:hypothetical protein n=1 Tax=Streptomyces sp. DH8 TaxID=2857008 RepID=UPI001E631D56|nr:hypothetical protein [Streptomyces sp. DH8]
MRRAWRLPVLFLLLGAVTATASARGGDPVAAVSLTALSVLAAVVNPPLVFPRRVPAAGHLTSRAWNSPATEYAYGWHGSVQLGRLNT